MGTGTPTYKHFTSDTWSLFEDLLTNRLININNALTTLQVQIVKPNAAGTADLLSTKREIDGVEFDGSSSVSHYGICNTAGSTAIKVVACTGFKLVTGAEITVRFDTENTAAEPISLNVNDTGAIPIKYHGITISGSDTLRKDYTYTFKYNGSWFEVVGTTYKVFEQATDQVAGKEGLVPAPALGNTGGTYLNSNGTWSVPTNTTYADFIPSTSDSAGTSGLVPAPLVGDNETKFLKADGTWKVPIDTTYVPFVAATSEAAGTEGLVPAPAIGDDATKFLNSVGSWVVPPVATQSSSGYMSPQDKIDLDNFYHQTNKAYSVGEQVHVPGQPNYLVLECIQAGVTGSTAPDFDESGYDEYQTNTAYSVGDQVRVPGQPSYLVLECQTAGTSGATAPDFS